MNKSENHVVVVLSQIYKPEVLFLKNAEVTGFRKYKFGFIFPPYGLTTQSIDHVSGIQMHLALNQGFMASIFLALEKNHIEKNVLDIYGDQRDAFSAMMTRENVDFVQPIKPNQLTELEFKLVIYGKMVVGKKHNVFRVDVNGFVKAEVVAMSKLVKVA